jgi:Tfp pilus assembly protein PilX
MDADATGRGALAAACRGIRRRATGRATWSGEDGIALILSVIVISVLTIATAATITMVNSNEHAFGRDREVNRALNIAEAGLNAGVAGVKALPATATSLPDASGTTDHGSWSYTASRVQDATNPDLYIWTVTSTGLSPIDNVTRVVSRKVSQTIIHHSTTTSTTTPTSEAYLYNFFLGDPASDCTTTGTGNLFSGNGAINVDLYARGSLCVNGNSSAGIFEPTGSTGTLNIYVGNKFRYSGQARIGTPTEKVNEARIVVGCIRPTGASVQCSSESNSHVYANNHPSTQNDVPKPTIDTNWYTNAKPGPTTGCNDDPTHPGNAAYMSSYPSGWTAAYFKDHVLDNNSTRDTSVGDVNLLRLTGSYSSAGDFDCRYYDSNGNLLGRLAWTYGNPGTLIISGTIFVDGNLVFDGTNYAVYQGRGNIYANGTVNWSGQATVCATPISGNPCLGNFDTSQNILEIVAVNASGGSSGFAVLGQQTFEGICFTNGAWSGGGNSVFHGAVIADTAVEQGNGGFTHQIIPPPGAPGAAQTTTSSTSEPDTAEYADVPGSWQQLQ